MLAVVAFLMAASASFAAGVSPLKERPWLDSSLPIDERVDKLIEEMTLEELCRQTWAVHNWHESETMWANASVGSIKLSAFPNKTAAEVLDYRNSIAQIFVEGGRLGLVPSFHQETLLSASPNSTNIPMPVTLGATWDVDVVRRANAVVSSELRAVGGDVGYSPEVNMYTDPRFGRLQEGFSSDPTLSSELGLAAVLGFQGDNGTGPGTYLPPLGAAALGKHFAAYGPAAGGQNVGKSEVSPQSLFDVYFRPWRLMSLEGGLRAYMPSHQTVFNVPMHGNAWAAGILRAGPSASGLGMNFSGWSTSDCSDIGVLVDWGLANDTLGAAVLGIRAVDMDNMCGQPWTYVNLQQAVTEGLVSRAVVAASARRVLSQKFASGIFDQWKVNTSGLTRIGSPEHLATAKEAAVKGAVLLQNEDSTLPLNLKDLSSVAVLGNLAGCFAEDDGVGGSEFDSGDSLCTAQEAFLGKPQHELGDLTIPTIAELVTADGIKNGFDVAISEGARADRPADPAQIEQAVAAAAGADVAIVVAGDTTSTCNEWKDRADLELSGGQAELLARLLASPSRPKRVVLVLVHGRPQTFTHNGTDLLPLLDAVVAGWRGGQFGGAALWDLLAGRESFSGRLPQPWLRSVGQVMGPASSWQLNGKWRSNGRGPKYQPGDAYPFNNYVFQDATPLFPLGFGLSYGDASFSYSGLAVSCPAAVTTSSSTLCDVSVTIKNEGKTSAGTETVQVYAGFPKPLPQGAQDWKRLAAFAKAEDVQPGESRTVKLAVRADVLAMTLPPQGTPLGGPAIGSRVVVPGVYTFSAGPDSLTDSQTTTAAVPACDLSL